jgi:glycosyltransferase involved in cell wall biosynthesis
MRVLFALAGLHRYDRGAEIAFISVAKELAKAGNAVTLIGSGRARMATPYRFLQAKSIARERFRAFPSIPLLRNDCAYEELTFVPDLLFKYRPADYDVTVTCSYPFTNWVLRRPTWKSRRPPHVFVTQNGDWPAYSDQSEYRWFGCEGLVCTNPDFYERNHTRWHCQLIPNGVDCEHFKPGMPQPDRFGLPQNKLIVLIVSALIPTKRVEVGIDVVSRIPGAHLVVAGNGPLRQTIESAAARLLPGRFTRLSVPAEQMPALYRSATVFLHLSKEESFGNVFLEAMASGLPVVAHDSSRLRWIVGDDQFLIDTSDCGAIATAINAAANAGLANPQKSVARATSFSWMKIGKMYQIFLQEVAART